MDVCYVWAIGGFGNQVVEQADALRHCSIPCLCRHISHSYITTRCPLPLWSTSGIPQQANLSAFVRFLLFFLVFCCSVFPLYFSYLSFWPYCGGPFKIAPNIASQHSADSCCCTYRFISYLIYVGWQYLGQMFILIGPNCWSWALLKYSLALLKYNT